MTGIKVIGQDHLKSQLATFAATAKIPHAMIFSGTAGREGLSLALATAKNIFCQESQNGEGCNNCKSCNFVDNLTHPDLHFIYPVVKHKNKKRDETTSEDFIKEWRELLNTSMHTITPQKWFDRIEAENRQANINARECLQIIRKLGLKSFSGGAKVMLMWLPEYLGQNGNRLLKLIEEPPPNTYLVFVTENEQNILNTLKSRCQILKLKPLKKEAIAQYLVKDLSISEEKADQIARASEGNLIRASELAEGAGDTMTDEVLQWFRLCFMMKPDLLMQWVQSFHSRSRVEQKNLLTHALYIIQNFLSLDHTRKASGFSGADYEKLKGLSNVLNLNKIESISLLMDEALQAIGRNANVKILMMADSLSIGDTLRERN